MLSSVLNSERAIQVNIQIMRTFIKLKEILYNHKDLQIKIDEIIRTHGGKLKSHDEQINAIFEAIHRLLKPAEENIPKEKYGFLADKQ